MFLLVDAMNVIGSRPTGWWRDRDGAVRLLLERLCRLSHEREYRIGVFVDGRALDDVPEGDSGCVEVWYARRPGRNAADDRIVEYVRDHEAPESLEVVTSDRVLASRVKAAGAHVRGARWLLDEMDGLDGGEGGR